MRYVTEPHVFEGTTIHKRITEDLYVAVLGDLEGLEKELDFIRCKRKVMPKYDMGMLQRAPKESFIDVPVKLCADDDEDLLGADAVFVLKEEK